MEASLANGMNQERRSLLFRNSYGAECMTHRVAILTEIISPYRIPVSNALAKREGIDLKVIFLSERTPLRGNGAYTKMKFVSPMGSCPLGGFVPAVRTCCRMAGFRHL